MNKFFSNKKLIILMIAVIFTFGLIAVSLNIRDNKNDSPFFQQAGNDTTSLFGRIISTPVNAIRNFGNNASDLMNTYSENKRLKAKLSEYEQTKVELSTKENENKDLKKQLDLYNTLTDYSRINASVINRSPSDWQNYLTINRGSLKGIKKNMPVMSGSGLIGRIADVNKTSSKVELISSENSSSNRFAAEVLSTSLNVNGVITGYNTNSGLLEMTQVNTVDGVVTGQKIITSGLGGITPRGLYIGKVLSVKKDNYGLSNVIYIKPATDLTKFTVVTVIDRSVGDN